MDLAWLYYIIPGTLLVAALVTMIVIYVRKFSTLAALDLSAMRAYREKARKTSLVEQRLQRKLLAARKTIMAILEPVGQTIQRWFKGTYNYIRSLEQRYREAAQQGRRSANPVMQQQSVSSLLESAKANVAAEKWAEAEKDYIAAIGLDTASVDAYRGLADVYLAMKNNDHALETLRFLQQLNPKDETVWQDLGDLYHQQYKLEEALEAYEAALELNPNNPKNLDAVVELAIASKLKYKAQSTVDKLQKVNPENEKIKTYQDQINQL